jgi:hypothetical protein
MAGNLSHATVPRESGRSQFEGVVRDSVTRCAWNRRLLCQATASRASLCPRAAVHRALSQWRYRDHPDPLRAARRGPLLFTRAQLSAGLLWLALRDE